jgi:TonB family protein
MGVRSKCALLLLLLALIPPLFASDRSDHSDDEQLLNTASHLADILSDNKPFEMDVDFVPEIKVPYHAHFTWKWAGNDLWSTSVTIGNFRETDIRKGEMLYISRNIGFTPLRVSQLEDLLTVFTFYPANEQIDSSHQLAVAGHKLHCVILNPKTKALPFREGPFGPSNLEPPYSQTSDVCLDPTTKEVIAIEEKSARHPKDYFEQIAEARSATHVQKEFNDYQPFRGHLYPRQLKFFSNGRPVVSATVTSLKDASFSDNTFIPAPDSIQRRQCKDMVPPHALKAPDPAYPERARHKKEMGSVMLWITVLPDGSVTNIQFLGTANQDLDEAAKETIKKWRFRPAMCGRNPVIVDVTVQMDFQLF